MSWDYICFDMDGTLSDSGPGITRCADYALRSLGVETDGPEALRFFIGPPLTESFGTICGLNDEQVQKGIALFRERYAEKGIHEHEPYPGIPEMVHALCEAGKHLQIASSKPRPYVLQILGDYGILNCFENIVASEFDGSLSKKADVIEELLRRLSEENADRDRIIMVGDRHYDVRGAHEHGLQCIGVRYGYGSAEELEEADYVVDSAEEMRELLLGKH
ncbi:MAG: HAD hydrolase-like protein [Oscillospiraceae bacterium]|nr:HAD hydrolase-like protein [Oscillospiraceae bacterium]